MADYPQKVFLNGKIVDHKDAKISVFDRGFIFGDGIYEVLVKIKGTFFYGEAHFDRLYNCLKRIEVDFDGGSLKKDIANLLSESNLVNDDCLLYIQVTRGVAPRKHAYPKEVKPTVMIYAIPFVLPEINEKHMITVTKPDIRWHLCDIKMTSLLGNIMANNYASEKNAYEAILVRDGMVTEASHCNVFFVKGETVYTHPANEMILDGITRQVVVQLCKDLNIDIKEEAVKARDIIQMDEAFLTGTTTQIASIKQIDDYQFYQDHTSGPMTKKLQKAFLELKDQDYED